MSVFLSADEYYITGSVSDPDGYWTDDANAIDGNTATSATSAGSSTVSTGYIEVTGLSLPSTYLSYHITRVLVIVNFNGTIGSRAFETRLADGTVIDTMSGIANTNSVSLPNTSAPNGNYWTKADVEGLKFRYYGASATSLAAVRVRLDAAPFVYSWYMGNTSALSTSAAQSHFPQHSAGATLNNTAANRAVSFAFPMSLGDPHVKFSVAPGTGTSRTLTVQNSGAATMAAVTVSDTNTTGSNNRRSLTIAATQLVDLRMSLSGTPAAANLAEAGLNIYSDRYPMVAATAANASTSVTSYMGLAHTSGIQTTTANASHTWLGAGKLKGFRFQIINATITSGSWLATMYKNGVAQDGAGGTPDTRMTVDSTNSAVSNTTTEVTTADNDTFYWEIVPSTPSNARPIAITSGFIPDTDGQFPVFNARGDNPGTGTQYSIFHGGEIWSGTESNRESYALAANLVKLYLLLGAALTSGQGRTIVVRKNSVDTSATVALVNSGTDGTWTGSVAFADGDIINVATTRTSTPTMSVNFALLMHKPVNYVIVPNDIQLGLTLDNTTVEEDVGTVDIYPADVELGLTLDTTTIEQNHIIVPADIEHGLTLDTTTIEQNHVIATADIEHGLTLDTTTITQNHVITSQDIELGLTLDNTTIDLSLQISPDDIELGLTLDNTTIEQNHIVVTQDIEHGLTLDNTTISGGATVIIQPGDITFGTAPRDYYIDSDGEIYWVIDQTLGLVEPI
jgi:hypothetical protein